MIIAIRYSNTNSGVLVQVYQEKNEVVLEVSDNGPGIQEDLYKRVFERFFRVIGNQTTGSD